MSSFEWQLWFGRLHVVTCKCTHVELQSSALFRLTVVVFSSSDIKDQKGLKSKWAPWMFPGTPQLSCNAAVRCLISSLTSLHKKCDIGSWRQDDKAPNDVMEFSISNSDEPPIFQQPTVTINRYETVRKEKKHILRTILHELTTTCD